MVKRRKLYDDMTPKEQERAVRRLMEAGGSNRSVARDLGTTPGTIAGIRNRKNIASKNQTPSMGKSEKKPEPENEAPALPAPELVEAKPEAKRLKMAATEATQCAAHDEEGHQCAYEHLPGSPYCGLPQHQKLKYKARRS